MKKIFLGVVACTACLAAATTTAFAGQAKSTASTAIRCNSTLKLGLVTPLTGGAGFLGQEQLTWAKFAVAVPSSGEAF